jgi:hypothetical protein
MNAQGEVLAVVDYRATVVVAVVPVACVVAVDCMAVDYQVERRQVVHTCPCQVDFACLHYKHFVER